MNQEILMYVTPSLTFIVGIYLRSLLKKIEHIESIKTDLELIKKEVTGMNGIKNEWSTMRIDIAKLIVEMDHIKKTQDDVAVIKRDQIAIWKNIDKIKDAIFEEYPEGNS